MEYFFKIKTTTAVYNLFYQDGLQHAFDYLNYHSNSGLTFNPDRIINSIRSYEELKPKLLKAKNYPDYAYVEGYISGLHSILFGEHTDQFPFYYIIGYGTVDTGKEFRSLLRKQAVYHKTADRIGKKYFNNILDKKSKVVPHHRAFIF